ncbi:unnamed protein product [Lactuca saligna]|uniref:Uncharacterized protein n=1 Tax=Lactuca saligna TaxID=75948 RepID=A0AA35USJ0_LACSI|nr:unnamed protein product [Lactuca saligna]
MDYAPRRRRTPIVLLLKLVRPSYKNIMPSSNQSLEGREKEERICDFAKSPRCGGDSATPWALKEDYDFSIFEPYQPPFSFQYCANENLVKQGNAKFMDHKDFKEKSEKEVNFYVVEPYQPLLPFEVFSFKRPRYQVSEPIESKEEDNDGLHFDKKNPKRDKTKARGMRMKKKPKRKHNKDVNPKMPKSLRKEFNRRVAYK